MTVADDKVCCFNPSYRSIVSTLTAIILGIGADLC